MERAREKAEGRASTRAKRAMRKLPRTGGNKARRAARRVAEVLAPVPKGVCPEDAAAARALAAACRRRALSVPSREDPQGAAHPWLERIARVFRVVVDVVAYLLGFRTAIRRLGHITRAHVLAVCHA